MVDMAVAGGLSSAQHLLQPSQTIHVHGSSRRKPNRITRRGNPVVSVSGSGDDDNRDKSKEERPSVDWDSAWSTYRRPRKSGSNPFGIDMEKYVSRRPTRSDYPLSEEVDPLRKTERSALGVWTDPRFTYAGFGVLLGLFVYMVIIVGPPPS
eukprot:TRINITY_DN6996_c0_g1_i1.p1 TRINITY_DN6996_c0_g1~~TRINITY_DN6996_c0_g1_i1.p1  ORF type:complete len:152 (-),score=8.33 TRINITY_DN6996_c0_g1_i1:197-652(-)